MFKGKFSLLFFLTVSVTFLFFFNTINEASPDPPQSKEEIIAKTEAGPGVDEPEAKKEKLAEKIVQDYANLKRLFDSEEHNFGKKMAKILGKKATIVFGDETIQGKKDIEDFWVNKRVTHQSAEFRLELAFIVSEEMAEMEEFDHIAYEFFVFSLFVQPEGKILKNQDGRGERSCRHIYGCECRTR